nr:dihydrodipicolinate synthase family protein [uncultured Sphingomonas sp.]
MFTGLCAFPPTPSDADGVVDAEAFAMLIDRAASAGVDSICILGSTGGFVYLDPPQRARAVRIAVEACSGRVPIVAGIGAMRTRWCTALARDAEHAGADGLLLPPLAYLPLTEAEVVTHYMAVAGATGLPLCIYNNPSTTHFRFTGDLIGRLAGVPNIDAIKMPPGGDPAASLALLRATTPSGFKIGHSGDWEAAAALGAGMDAWFSVIAGLLPAPALRLTRAAQHGDIQQAQAIDAAFAPLWALFQTHGSFRLLSNIGDRLGLRLGDPPLPLQRVDREVASEIDACLAQLAAV